MATQNMYFFFSSRRRHTRWNCDWSSDVCSSDLLAIALRVEKRADAEPISRDEDSLGVAVVDCERKLSVQAHEQIHSPFFVAMHEDFGVGASPEDVTLVLQLAAELGMVVDRPVVGHDDLPVLVRQRLRAPGDVYSAEAYVGETDPLADEETVPVGAAMADGRRHSTE